MGSGFPVSPLSLCEFQVPVLQPCQGKELGHSSAGEILGNSWLHLGICGSKLPLLYPWICLSDGSQSMWEFQSPKHLDAVHMATFARGQLGSVRASHAGRNARIIPGISRAQSQLCHWFPLEPRLAFSGAPDVCCLFRHPGLTRIRRAEPGKCPGLIRT